MAESGPTDPRMTRTAAIVVGTLVIAGTVVACGLCLSLWGWWG